MVTLNDVLGIKFNANISPQLSGNLQIGGQRNFTDSRQYDWKQTNMPIDASRRSYTYAPTNTDSSQKVFNPQIIFGSSGSSIGGGTFNPGTQVSPSLRLDQSGAISPYVSYPSSQSNSPSNLLADFGGIPIVLVVAGIIGIMLLSKG